MKTLVATRIILSNTAYLATDNLKSINTFILKALKSLNNKNNSTIEDVSAIITTLVQENFSSDYTIDLVPDDSVDYSAECEYVKIKISLINDIYLSKSYH